MEPDASNSFAVVEEGAAADVLADLARVRWLVPFLGRERLVSEVAEELGLATDAMYYRVTRLLEADLLETARTVPRKGRALRYYRARADHFFVPLSAIPERTVEEWLAEGDAAMRGRIVRGLARAMRDPQAPLRMGIHVRRDPTGAPDIGIGPNEADWRARGLLDPAVPAIVSAWAPLQLEFDDAKRLQRELFDVLERYRDLRGAQRYVLGLALAPTEADDG